MNQINEGILQEQVFTRKKEDNLILWVIISFDIVFSNFSSFPHEDRL